MNHYIVRTIRRSNNQVVVDDYFCEECWKKLKDLEGYKSDLTYEIKVIPTTFCEECYNCDENKETTS